MGSAALSISDFSPGADDTDAVKEAMNSESYLYSNEKLSQPVQVKRVRVVSNDTIMSKLATTLIVNMSTFGMLCIIKADRQHLTSFGWKSVVVSRG